jgi:hypothetical protein
MDGATRPRRLRNTMEQRRETPLMIRSCRSEGFLEYLDELDRNGACLLRTSDGIFFGFQRLWEPMATTLTPSIRTLRLKVKREAYAWLNAATIEVGHRLGTDSAGQCGVRYAPQTG